MKVQQHWPLPFDPTKIEEVEATRALRITASFPFIPNYANCLNYTHLFPSSSLEYKPWPALAISADNTMWDTVKVFCNATTYAS